MGIEDARKWLSDKVDAQAEKDGHEDPVFTSEEVPLQTKPIQKLIAKLSKKPKPKPPKDEEESASAGTSDTDGKESNEEDGEGAKVKEETSDTSSEEKEKSDTGNELWLSNVVNRIICTAL